MQRMLSDPPELKCAPPTAIDAKFSLPFTVASAFIQPDVTLDSFSERALIDPATRALARRIHIEPRPDWGVEKATAGAIEVELARGERFEHEVSQAAGHPDAPLDPGILRAKFIDCATRAARPLARAPTENLIDRMLSLASAPEVNLWLAPVLGLDANPESM
jgi:2-methylcitrate dehydratase PrpD